MTAAASVALAGVLAAAAAAVATGAAGVAAAGGASAVLAARALPAATRKRSGRRRRPCRFRRSHRALRWRWRPAATSSRLRPQSILRERKSRLRCRDPCVLAGAFVRRSPAHVSVAAEGAPPRPPERVRRRAPSPRPQRSAEGHRPVQRIEPGAVALPARRRQTPRPSVPAESTNTPRALAGGLVLTERDSLRRQDGGRRRLELLQPRVDERAAEHGASDALDRRRRKREHRDREERHEHRDAECEDDAVPLAPERASARREIAVRGRSPQCCPPSPSSRAGSLPQMGGQYDRAVGGVSPIRGAAPESSLVRAMRSVRYRSFEPFDAFPLHSGETLGAAVGGEGGAQRQRGTRARTS